MDQGARPRRHNLIKKKRKRTIGDRERAGDTVTTRKGKESRGGGFDFCSPKCTDAICAIFSPPPPQLT